LGIPDTGDIVFIASVSVNRQFITSGEEAMNSHNPRLVRVLTGLSALLLLSEPSLMAQCPTVPGDLNGNNLVNVGDVGPLVNCLVAGGPCTCADVNQDGLANGRDIHCFVQVVLGNPGACVATVQSSYEPGPEDTPPASPCGETRCADRPDRGAILTTYLATGEFYHTAVDMRIRGRGLDFIWARKYRSRFGPNTEMGNGWDYSYNIYLQTVGPDLLLHDGNSRQDIYTLQPNGKWARDEFFREITLNGNGTFTLTFADKGVWIFNAIAGNPQLSAGKIQQIQDRNGNTMQFQYDAQGRLQAIFDTLGRQIQVAYNVNNLITTITDFTGRQVAYSYYQNGDAGGAARDLRSARSPIVFVAAPADHNNFPAGKTTTYTYSINAAHPSLNGNMLTITDPKGQTYVTNSYHPTTSPGSLDFDRLTRQVWGNANDLIDLVYVAQTPGPANNNATVKAILNDRGTSTPPSTTPSGSNVHEYFYDAGNRLVMRHDYTGRAIANQPTTDVLNRPTNKLRPTDPNRYETRWNYNPDSLVTRATYPNLNFTTYTYELALNPAAPRRSRGNLRQRVRDNGSGGTIAEAFTYELDLGGCGCGSNFVKTFTDGRGFVTTHTYNPQGNRTHTDYPPGGGVEDWSYNVFGQVLTHTLPANPDGHRRMDAYVYYAAGPQNGYLQSETIDDPGLKLKTTYEYDARGNSTRIVSPRGNALPPLAGQDTLITYNQLDQAVRELSREVGGVRYETKTWYDANDNLARVDRQNVDENGVVQPNTHLTTIHEYEILNRRISTCTEKGNVAPANSVITCAGIPNNEAIRTAYDYDPNRNQTRTLNPQAFAIVNPHVNDTTDVEFDERDKPYRSIRAKGDPNLRRTTQTDYDGNGNATILRSALEDGFTRLTTQTYDGFDRLVAATDPMGNVTTRTYDANSNIVNVRMDGELNDVAGGAGNVRLTETTTSYDAMNRPFTTNVAHFNVSTQAAIGDGFSTTSTVYGHNGQVDTVTNDRGATVSNLYDTANRVATVIDPLNNSVNTFYDADSNVLNTQETEIPDLPGVPEVFLTTHTYDGQGRQLSTTDSFGNLTSRKYDSRSNVTAATDARGKFSRASYDGADRLLQSTMDMDGDGADGDGTDIVIGTAWDDGSRTVGMTDGNVNSTTESLNARGEPALTNLADGCSADVRNFDVHGNAVTTTDANGTVVTHIYDLLNRVTQKTITPGPGVAATTTFKTFSYDGAGRLVAAQNDNSTITRTYDSLGNVLTDAQNAPTLGGLRTVVSTYDGVGNKLTQVTPIRTVTMVYDLLNRMKTIGDNFIPIIATYDYVGPSRVLRRTYQPGTPNETRCDYQYDPARRITQTSHTRIAPGDIDNRQYGWDPNYNKTTRMVNPSSGSGVYQSTFDYDAANRLTNSITLDMLSGGNDRTNIYALDLVGNRDTVSGINTLDAGAYAMTSGCEPADREMNQYTSTPAGGRDYDKNGNTLAWNTGAPDAGIATYDYANRMVSSTVFAVTTLYHYDALGRRIAKCNAACGPPASTMRFTYDGWREVHASGGGVGVFTFVYGNYIDEVLTMRRGTTNYFYHSDDLFNVVALTDATGNVVERYEYDDYGRPVNAVTLSPIAGNPSASLINNPLLFNGRRYDVETGWYDYRTRYLDPRAGRFITRDTIGIWGDSADKGNGTNALAVNPTSFLDPYGDKVGCLQVGAEATVVGGIAGTMALCIDECGNAGLLPSIEGAMGFNIGVSGNITGGSYKCLKDLLGKYRRANVTGYFASGTAQWSATRPPLSGDGGALGGGISTKGFGFSVGWGYTFDFLRTDYECPCDKPRHKTNAEIQAELESKKKLIEKQVDAAARDFFLAYPREAKLVWPKDLPRPPDSRRDLWDLDRPWSPTSLMRPRYDFVTGKTRSEPYDVFRDIRGDEQWERWHRTSDPQTMEKRLRDPLQSIRSLDEQIKKLRTGGR